MKLGAVYIAKTDDSRHTHTVSSGKKQCGRHVDLKAFQAAYTRTEGEKMSEFTVYPAIDMRNGKCVRLIQGDYEKETIYGHSPLEMASRFAEEGASWIHLVDLDGASLGPPSQRLATSSHTRLFRS